MVLPAIVAGIAYAITSTLSLFGFSSVGPVAGSIAAWVQSVVYGAAVPAGSLFSLLQSMAMGGAISGGVLAIAGTLLTAIGATIFIITWPLLAAFLSADSYRQWIHDALQGTPQVSLKELLCRGFLFRHLFKSVCNA